jgi:hypothetical protein
MAQHVGTLKVTIAVKPRPQFKMSIEERTRPLQHPHHILFLHCPLHAAAARTAPAANQSRPGYVSGPTRTVQFILADFCRQA